MKLDRVELADIHAPRRLAYAVHCQMGDVGHRVDVETVAKALDIGHIELCILDGFEGMLLTDKIRSEGTIIANTRGGGRRARFTIAHELGHFLMEKHVLTDATGFRCRAQDMRETSEGRRDLKQEAQANQFAIELLAPALTFETCLSGEPDLRDAQRARDQFDISLEASVRRMVDLHPEALAAFWSHNGIVRYHNKGAEFPWINRKPRDKLASTTLASQALSNGSRGFTEFSETHSAAWTDAPNVELWEQTRVGANGHAVTLLWAELPNNGETETDSAEELGMPRFR